MLIPKEKFGKPKFIQIEVTKFWFLFWGKKMWKKENFLRSQTKLRSIGDKTALNKKAFLSRAKAFLHKEGWLENLGFE